MTFSILLLLPCWNALFKINWVCVSRIWPLTLCNIECNALHSRKNRMNCLLTLERWELCFCAESSFMIKTHTKKKIEGLYLNKTRAHMKTWASIVPNRENIKISPRRAGEDSAFALHSFNTVLKVFATALKQEREIKGLKTGKKEVRPSVFVDDVTPRDPAELKILSFLFLVGSWPLVWLLHARQLWVRHEAELNWVAWNTLYILNQAVHAAGVGFLITRTCNSPWKTAIPETSLWPQAASDMMLTRAHSVFTWGCPF